METWQQLITLLWTVLFCLGWNLSLEEGRIFHFIRKPFVNLYDQIENAKELYKVHQPNPYQKHVLLIQRITLFILTPLILCITCMASVWGVAVFYVLNGISIGLVPHLVLNCFAASFIQTFIWNLYVRISN